MNSDIPCILYSQDENLVQRIRGFLGLRVALNVIAAPAELRYALQQRAPSLTLMDLRGPEIRTVLLEILRDDTTHLVIAFGIPRTEPALQAESMGVYAVCPLDFDGATLQALVRQALDYLRVTSELEAFRQRAATEPPPGPVAAKVPARAAPRYAIPPLRRFGNLSGLLQAILDDAAQSAMVLRAGIFVRARDQDVFHLAAARSCRNETAELAIPSEDPFVRWMELNAQLVCRSALGHVQDVQDQLLLRRMLDALAAEMIVPLHGRDRMLGWLFLGRMATGAPFEAGDMHDIMGLADHIATVIENALLYEEVALQKTFAETLLHSIPTGIVAADEKGNVRWFNHAAEEILGARHEDTLGRSFEILGSRLAAQIRRALAGEPASDAEWQDPLSRRHLSVRTARLTRGADCLGAVAFVHDLTPERLLQKKQRELDRGAFWNELAASMSHEIRNPLVAIKTFAQLLPERFADAEFRTEFSSVVTQEVDRLNAIISQINTFANLPAPKFETLHVKETVLQGLGLARMRVSPNGVDLRTSFAEDMPPLLGDKRALAECFAHVIGNAMEATRNRKDARIEVRAQPAAGPGARGVEVTIRDNGGGIPPELKDNVFSPFCTGKGSGMGLGLPIAQRTVADHNGSLHIDTGESGTTVTIALPETADPEE